MTEFKLKYCKHLQWSFSDLIYHKYWPIQLQKDRGWTARFPYLIVSFHSWGRKTLPFSERLTVSRVYQISFLRFIITGKSEKLEEELLNKLTILILPKVCTIRIV